MQNICNKAHRRSEYISQLLSYRQYIYKTELRAATNRTFFWPIFPSYLVINP